MAMKVADRVLVDTNGVYPGFQAHGFFPISRVSPEVLIHAEKHSRLS